MFIKLFIIYYMYFKFLDLNFSYKLYYLLQKNFKCFWVQGKGYVCIWCVELDIIMKEEILLCEWFCFCLYIYCNN